MDPRSTMEPGSRFGRLTVIRRDGATRFKEVKWLCQCDCGELSSVKGKSLRAGVTKSCGCLAIDKSRERKVTHGMRGSREYSIWRSMKARCLNPRNHAYSRYGGRGITVHEKWIDSFEAFYRDMGTCPKGMTIERINNDDGYHPGNCKWATQEEQNLNRSNTLPVRLKEIAEELGLTYGATYQRWKRGQL